MRPEDFSGEKSQVTELVSEFLGTYMLVLTVGLNVLGKSKAAAFSIAAGLASMIYALGDVSGAHFNPAVTVAILASGRCPDLTPAKAGMYAGVQIAGGIAAALTYAFIYQGATFALGPVGFSTWAGVLWPRLSIPSFFASWCFAWPCLSAQRPLICLALPLAPA